MVKLVTAEELEQIYLSGVEIVPGQFQVIDNGERNDLAFWTIEQRERLQELLPTHTTRVIVRILNEEFGTERTIDSIYACANRYGYSYGPSVNGQFWTTPQRNMLENLAEKYGQAEIAKMINSRFGTSRTGNAVRKRAELDGIRLNGNNVLSRGNIWTNPQVERLRELAGKYTLQEISEMMRKEFGVKRTESAIEQHADILGIDFVLIDSYCVQGIVELFSIAWTSVDFWLKSGKLQSMIHRHDAKKNKLRYIKKEWVNDFIRNYPEAYDRNKITIKEFKDLADEVWEDNQFVSVSEFAQLCGVANATVQIYCHKGILPAKKKILRGKGIWSPWVIDRRLARTFKVRYPALIGNDNKHKKAS